MGFDNECIANIQSLAGEYFCPVCRLLVNPNEAFQSQCTHLYCKPCLGYIANSTRACPYDGYLVTEADSKLLTESNKALAETIGKVPVHCLYHRSGCTWQGSLSECLNHCPGCAFGNSPVVCNRCGIQIVHRQVLEHAQSCPGVHAQPLAEGSQLTSVTSAADQSLSLKNSGISNSQSAPISQTVLPGPVSNPQITTSAQVPVAGQTIAPTSEQWYQQQQQQYQQYYQQFVGYDPYQQYYPYQSQQSQVYVQPLVPSQPQPHSQSQAQPQPQPLVQGLPPGQQHLLLQPQPRAPATATAPPPNSHVQSTIPPPSQLPSQIQSYQHVTLSITLPASSSKSAHYPNQPYMQASTQLPLNQQSQAQMPQPAVQPTISSSLQRQPNAIPQIPSKTHPAAAIPYLHLPGNQQVISQTQGQLPSTQSMTGFHSYPQPQPPPGAPQPLPILVQPNTQPHLTQNQVQFPQPSQVRPFQSQVIISNQQQSQVPPVQQQPMHPQSQLPGLPVPQRPVIQQYPQPISQPISLPQMQPFGGQSALVQNSQSSIHQQLPTQSQLRPPGQSFPPHMEHGAFVQHQPNASASINLRAPNLVGRPALTSGGAPPIFPHMVGSANSYAMLAGFNPNNIINSRGEVHPPSEQQHSRILHSKPENNANVKNVDLLSKAVIGTDGASSTLGNDGQQGLSEVGECKHSDTSAYENQESASINDSKDIAKQASTHDIANSNRSDGRLGKDGDQKDVPVIKFEEKFMQEDKKLIDGFPLSQEDGKLGLPMVSSLKGSGNETNVACQSGQEENKLAHAQALVNSFGNGVSRQHADDALHPSQPVLGIDHERNRNSQFHIGPSFVSSSIHRNPVGPSHQLHLPTLPMSHHVTPDFENSLSGQAQKTHYDDSFGGMHDSASSGTVVRPFLPGTDGIVGHKHPNPTLEIDKHFNPSFGYMDGGTPDPRFVSSMKSGVFGHPSDIRSNRSRVVGRPGVHPLLESIPGDRSDRPFIEPPHYAYDHFINHEDGMKFRGPHQDVSAVGTFGHFHSGSPLRKKLAAKSFNGHNLDWPGPVAASSRNLQPFGPYAGMVERPFGHPDERIQRISSLRMPVRHFKPVPGLRRRDMDGLPAHSPGREYSALPRNSFGDITGVPLKNLGPELDKGDPYSGSRFFPESRFPGLHGPFQKEFGETRNLRMAELVRNGDQIPHNLMHGDFQRGQLGSRHFRVGEPVGLGSSHDPARELTGPESFGKGRLNYPQFLEPRFRSNISPHEFLKDGKYPGDPKSFDNSRKRLMESMGWCRICKIDCETVEGLEMHSQTREHQKAAIDIVCSIKQQNAKKHKRSSANLAPTEAAGKL